MRSDREKWDRKHAHSEHSRDPAQIVKEHWQRATRGQALDIACGCGRNSIFLAEQGFQVDAVDISPVALSRVHHPRVQTLERDLDDYRIQADRYDLILNLNFLDRDLFPAMETGLVDGGLLIFETYLAASEHVSNPAYKLSPGELKRSFASLEVLVYREKAGRASLVARKKVGPTPDGNF